MFGGGGGLDRGCLHCSGGCLLRSLRPYDLKRNVFVCTFGRAWACERNQPRSHPVLGEHAQPSTHPQHRCCCCGCCWVLWSHLWFYCAGNVYEIFPVADVPMADGGGLGLVVALRLFLRARCLRVSEHRSTDPLCVRAHHGGRFELFKSTAYGLPIPKTFVRGAIKYL